MRRKQVDHAWLWRGDHYASGPEGATLLQGRPIPPYSNWVDNGFRVGPTAEHVTAYCMMSEHEQF